MYTNRMQIKQHPPWSILAHVKSASLDDFYPDEEDLRAQSGIAWTCIDEVGGCVCCGPVSEASHSFCGSAGRTDCPVKEPVRGCGHGQRFCAHFERKNLASDNPGARSPRRCEEVNVNAHEGNERFLCWGIAGSDDGANDRDDELADAHSDGTTEQ